MIENDPQNELTDQFEMLENYLGITVSDLEKGFKSAYVLKNELRKEKINCFINGQTNNDINLEWWGTKLHITTAYCLAKCLDEFDGSPLGLTMLLPRHLVPISYLEENYEYEAIRNARKWCKIYGHRIANIYQRVAAKVASKCKI
jgi:hypothetical protein